MNELLTRIGNSIYKDLLSEDTQKENAKEFIEKFDSLIKQRDTSDVWRQFVIFMLIDPAYGAIKFTKIGSIQYDAIQRVAQLYIDDCKDADQWRAASSEVEAAWLGVIVGISDATFHAGHAAGHAAAAARWHLTASVHGGVAVDIAALAAGLFVDSYLGAAVEDAVDSGNDRGGARERYVILMAYKLLELMKKAPEAT